MDQALLNFMLHKCYRLIYVLLSASEPIAEALMPIHNQLLTVRRCLLEVKKWGGDFTGMHFSLFFICFCLLTLPAVFHCGLAFTFASSDIPICFLIVRDLYPYQMKLASMDNMRVDGKFLDKDKEIPEGQGICNSLLSECYDILYELQESVVEETSDADDDDGDEVELRESGSLDVVV